LKRIKIEHETEGVPSGALREISILRTTNHDNIVKLLHIEYSISKLYLVFEYVDNDLAFFLDQISNGQGLEPMWVKMLVQQLMNGIHYLHCNRIYHRDLKPQNLLIDSYGKLKICDLGLARVICQPLRPYTQEVVTLWYRPPEVLLHGESYDSAVDIWSAGCIIMEIATTKPLFPGGDEMDQLYKIFRVLGTPTEDTFPGFKSFPLYRENIPKWTRQSLRTLYQDVNDNLIIDLVEKMLLYNPSHRITAQMAKDHPYLYPEPTSFYDIKTQN